MIIDHGKRFFMDLIFDIVYTVLSEANIELQWTLKSDQFFPQKFICFPKKLLFTLNFFTISLKWIFIQKYVDLHCVHTFEIQPGGDERNTRLVSPSLQAFSQAALRSPCLWPDTRVCGGRLWNGRQYDNLDGLKSLQGGKRGRLRWWCCRQTWRGRSGVPHWRLPQWESSES